MKSVLKIAFIVLLGSLVACDKKEKPLYDQVMDIHDEVMPKVGDLYKKRKHLQDSITKTADMPAEKRAEFEKTIQTLETAEKSMMDWMHNFNPPEPTEKKAYQKYMESELVKVKEMRETVLRAIENAEKATGKR
jgi:hypothetical protein